MNRLCIARLLLVVVAALQPVGANAFEFGACIHLALNRGTASQVLPALAAGGFTSLRDDVYWGAVEIERNALAFPEKYRQLDIAVRAVRKSGGKPLLILDFGNKFYDNGGLVVSPEGLDAFERYVRFIVRHFGADGTQYEVWNEWNTGFGSNPKQSKGDAAAYARLLERTYRAVKDENPAAVVIGGAIAGVDLPWVREFVAAGGLAHLDGFSVHSYTIFRQYANPEGAIRSLDRLQQILRAGAADREVPVFITEMGWPTNTGRYGVTEAQAAQYLTRFMLLARARSWIAGVWWYDLIDDGDSNTSSEHRFGLHRRGMTAKPALHAAARIAPLVRQTDPIHAYRLSSGGYAVTGAVGGRQWLVAWNLEPVLLGSAESIADAEQGSREFDWVQAELQQPGVPLFWIRSGDHWNRVASSPNSPGEFRVEGK